MRPCGRVMLVTDGRFSRVRSASATRVVASTRSPSMLPPRVSGAQRRPFCAACRREIGFWWLVLCVSGFSAECLKLGFEPPDNIQRKPRNQVVEIRIAVTIRLRRVGPVRSQKRTAEPLSAKKRHVVVDSFLSRVRVPHRGPQDWVRWGRRGYQAWVKNCRGESAHPDNNGVQRGQKPRR